MRRWLFVLPVLVVGCDWFLPFILPPGDMTVVPGGLNDTRPFFGRVRTADTAELDVGGFLLASCGCGFWRTLITPDDGSAQTQFTVDFYTIGDYVPTGEVTAYGDDEKGTLRGIVDQDAGGTEGRVQAGALRMFFNATRGEQHTDSVDACLLCHIGDDPIWPLPETHTGHTVDPPNCLNCHTVN